MFIVIDTVIREVMCVAWVMEQRVREYAGAYDSRVGKMVRVCKLLKVFDLNIYCKLVMLVWVERYECEYVSRVVNLNVIRALWSWTYV